MRYLGSSPHMRGTPSPPPTLTLSAGIIPAYAGNTGFSCNCFPQCRDHPRICGEHVVSDVLFAVDSGSSPHMRGTPDLHGKLSDHLGIIPAYAGNTCRKSLRRFATGDHPRICGEHFRVVSRISIERGSSPHMRGTQMFKGGTERTGGIIPAYAGNTFFLSHVRR